MKPFLSYKSKAAFEINNIFLTFYYTVKYQTVLNLFGGGGGWWCHFDIWFCMLYLNLSKVLFLIYITIIPEKKRLKEKRHQTLGQHNNNNVNPITVTVPYYKSILIYLQGSDELHWSNSRFLPTPEPAAIHQKRL